MADPLITTSSLIGVAHVVSSIISYSYYYQQSAKGARTYTRRLILEAQTLRNMVEGLLKTITEDESFGIDNSFSLAGGLSEGRRVFGARWNHLSQLEDRLRRPVERWNMSAICLTWPIHESEVNDTVECLQWMKIFIESGLSIDTVVSISPAKGNIPEAKWLFNGKGTVLCLQNRQS